jgi:hypothetical protein
LCIRKRVFIIAMEGGGNIRGCHLNLLSLNGGEQDTLPIAIREEVCIELDNQPRVCHGGDGFEQLLQPSAFEFLDRPLGCFKIFEVTVDVEFGLKNFFTLLTSGMEGLGTRA